MNVSDLMLPDKFETMNSMAFATNLYQEEAVAYAHWFGKYLCNRFRLQSARSFLKTEEFLNVLPLSLHLWGEMQYPRSEFVRTAVSRDTLDKDPDDEFELRETDAETKISDPMIYDEWDSRPDIGLSTAIDAEGGLLDDELLGKAYEFVELRNAAPRSKS